MNLKKDPIGYELNRIEMAADIHKAVEAANVKFTPEERKKIAEAGEKNGTFHVVVSDGTLSRNGYRILPEGMNLEFFKKNPVVQASHAGSKIPIGVATEILYNEQEDRVEMRGVFASNQEARERKELYDMGLAATSVGIIVEKTDTGDWNFSVVEQCELVEVSFVNVPANKMVKKLQALEEADQRRVLEILDAQEAVIAEDGDGDSTDEDEPENTPEGEGENSVDPEDDTQGEKEEGNEPEDDTEPEENDEPEKEEKAGKVEVHNNILIALDKVATAVEKIDERLTKLENGQNNSPENKDGEGDGDQPDSATEAHKILKRINGLSAKALQTWNTRRSQGDNINQKNEPTK